MRAVTIAAGAALVGSAVAGSHVQRMHQKLHARSEWGDWSTTEDPVDETTKSVPWTSKATPVADTSSDWSDPSEETAKPTWTGSWSTPVVATSTSSTWEDWSSTTSKKSDPTSTTVSWEDWSSTTSKKADPTSSTTVSWEDWSSTTSKKADPTTTESWADWETTKTPVVATTSAATTWADWSSEADPATSTETWGDWSDSVVVTTIHTTTTTTVWLGVVASTIAADSTWADWASTTTSTPVVAVSTSTAGWSSDGWFGAPWPVDATVCVQQILTSYGAATWYPTPKATVTVSPVASSSWDDWSSTTKSTPVVVTSSSTWADWESTSTPVVVTSTTSAGWGSASWSGSSSAAANWPSSTGSLKSNGNYFGMTYSPYTNAGGCKDAWTVSADIAVIASKGFTTVRVYSTDCSTLENVGAAVKEHGMKMILGVFISSTGIAGAQEQVTDITAWAQWDLVELIVVGNEAVFNGYCSASDLAGFISSSKWAFSAAGYKGAVTTTEPLTTWESTGTSFCGVVDVVAANLYAFFNAQTTADKAGDLIQAQIGILNGICPGKETYVMESGWPSAGNCNGVACPSPENQAIAIKSIQAASGSKIVFFSYEDEAWKAPGEFNVEQHWGCASVF